jgi:hypothetical protein
MRLRVVHASLPSRAAIMLQTALSFSKTLGLELTSAIFLKPHRSHARCLCASCDGCRQSTV